MSSPSRPVHVFLSYSERDKSFLETFQKHLAELQRQGRITVWTEQELLAGDVRKSRVDEELDRADMVLLLVSADYLSNDEIQRDEMSAALERHQKGKARVIPILLRAVSLAGTRLEQLEPLPSDLKPVEKPGNDNAWKKVVDGLSRVLEAIEVGEEPGAAGVRTSGGPPARRLSPVPSGRSLPPVPSALAGAATQGRLVIVVGSRVSSDAGLPAWEALLVQLLRKGREEAGSLAGDVGEISKWLDEAQRRLDTQHLGETLGALQEAFSRLRSDREIALAEEIAEVLQRNDEPTSGILEILPELEGVIFISAAYDLSLERALESQGARKPVIRTLEGIEEVNQAAPGTVLMLRGDIRDPGRMILSRSDFRRLGHNSARRLKEKLEALLSECRMLWVGFRPGDPDLETALDLLGSAGAADEGRIYWVAAADTKNQLFAREHALELIGIDDEDVRAWLYKLTVGIVRLRSRNEHRVIAQPYIDHTMEAFKEERRRAREAYLRHEYETVLTENRELIDEAEKLLRADPENKDMVAFVANCRINVAACLLNLQRKEEARAELETLSLENVEPASRSAFAQLLDLEAPPTGRFYSLEETREQRRRRSTLLGREPDRFPVCVPFLNDAFTFLEPDAGRECRFEAMAWRQEGIPELSVFPSSSISSDIARALPWIYEEKRQRAWISRLREILRHLTQQNESLTDIVIDLPPGLWGFAHGVLHVLWTLGRPQPAGGLTDENLSWRINPFLVSSPDRNDLVIALEHYVKLSQELPELRVQINRCRALDTPNEVRKRIPKHIRELGVDEKLIFVDELENTLGRLFRDGAWAMDDAGEIAALEEKLLPKELRCEGAMTDVGEVVTLEKKPLPEELQKLLPEELL